MAGTRLSVAYDNFYASPMIQQQQPLSPPHQEEQYEHHHQYAPSLPPPPPQVAAPVTVPTVVEYQQQPEPFFQQQQHYFQQQPAAVEEAITLSEMFWERKKDICKVFTFALGIVLAISLHQLFMFLFKEVIKYDALTNINHKLLVNVCYSFLLIIAIWSIKVLQNM